MTESTPDNWEEMSLPAWGAWIEICIFGGSNRDNDVAPRMGSVD